MRRELADEAGTPPRERPPHELVTSRALGRQAEHGSLKAVTVGQCGAHADAAEPDRQRKALGLREGRQGPHRVDGCTIAAILLLARRSNSTGSVAGRV